MPAPTPPKPGKVPFKKILKQFERIFDWQKRNRPIYGGLLEQRPNGFIVRRPDAAATEYVPPLSPLLTESTSGTTLGITSGWVHTPNDIELDIIHEIQTKALYPWMPTIGSPAVGLDSDTPNVLNLTDGVTNQIYLQINLVVLESTIGASDISAGFIGNTVLMSTVNVAATSTELSTGGTNLIAIDTTDAGSAHNHTISVEADFPASGDNHSHTGSTGNESSHTHSIPNADLPSHSHTITTTAHSHPAMAAMANLSYHVSVAPEFKVVAGAITAIPTDTELFKYIPWGEYVLDSDGIATSEKWYRNHLDYSPPNYTVSVLSTGQTLGGGDDRSSNPKT